MLGVCLLVLQCAVFEPAAVQAALEVASMSPSSPLIPVIRIPLPPGGAHAGMVLRVVLGSSVPLGSRLTVRSAADARLIGTVSPYGSAARAGREFLMVVPPDLASRPGSEGVLEVVVEQLHGADTPPGSHLPARMPTFSLQPR